MKRIYNTLQNFWSSLSVGRSPIINWPWYHTTVEVIEYGDDNEIVLKHHWAGAGNWQFHWITDIDEN